MPADSPPPLEKIQKASTPLKGLRKGFLLRGNDPQNSTVRGSSCYQASTAMNDDVVAGMEAIIRDHYKSDTFFNSKSPNNGIVSCEPEKDLANMLDQLRKDPASFQRALNSNPQGAESFRKLMGRLGQYFEDLADTCSAKGSSEARRGHPLDDPELKPLVHAIEKGIRVDPRLLEARNP